MLMWGMGAILFRPQTDDDNDDDNGEEEEEEEEEVKVRKVRLTEKK